MSRRRKRKVHKPTGSIGHIEVDPEAKTADFMPVDFPSTKAEIEQYMLRRVLASPNEAALKFYKLSGTPIRNPESHFDFTLPTINGLQYLDLMEIKPTDGRHATAPGSYWVWDFAEAVYAQLKRKSDKYGAERADKIHLVLYNTDWRQVPDRGVMQLLMVWLAHGTHCFRTVVNYALYGGGDGELFRLFPSRPEERRRIDVHALRKDAVMGADFSKVRVEPGGAAVVPVSPPPPGWRPDL